MEESVKPDLVEAEAAGAPDEGDGGTQTVTHPTKLIRIASMTRAMLEETRQAPVDDSGRERLAEVHSRSLDELREVLSPELLDEFNEIMIPLEDSEVSEAEVRVAQAQLIGWLEGLFHGIQASLWSQQMAAQSQLAEMQKRALGRPATPPQPGKQPEQSSGLYL